MKKTDKEYIHELGMDELLERITQEQIKFQRTKFRHAVSPIENPLTIREMRRNIARLKTELKRREMAETQKQTDDGAE